ncbi:MAG: hypothetical protein A3J29_19295 [Acidobacteria bacterium RIFCSPLOWO2_12_FULL_67_14b]|nr:MAG: hypothetical protein A3J29_19295 [Acidobacteria bacterium RIFCSPLOWO2_12_FULL_67_14b]
MAIDTGESGLFAIYENGHAVYVDKADSPQPVATSVSIGSRSPAYATATGKALLAYQPAAEIERVIGQACACMPRTLTGRRVLLAELERVRERRLAYSVGEWHEEIAGAPAPVFGHSGEVVGAVGISCPRARVEERIEVLGAIVQSAAKELSDI